VLYIKMYSVFAVCSSFQTSASDKITISLVRLGGVTNPVSLTGDQGASLCDQLVAITIYSVM